eukprot:1158695-Prymnesium_polylepis.1
MGEGSAPKHLALPHSPRHLALPHSLRLIGARGFAGTLLDSKVKCGGEQLSEEAARRARVAH